MSKVSTSIWSGVYGSFDDVPSSDTVFNSDVWANKQRTRILEALESFEKESSLPKTAVSKDYPFPTMVAMMLLDNPSLRIVDYGGAMGQSYLDLLAKVPDAEKKLNYTIVEMNALIDNVPLEMQAFKNLTFTEDVAKLKGAADIVHIGSTLQYIDDWRSFLQGLLEQFQPRLFILSDLLIGDIPSFVTAQEYYGHTIPARFTNIDEFQGFWKGLGYKLAYKSYFQPLESDDYFPNHALPETHRIKKACHMVFARGEEGDDG